MTPTRYHLTAAQAAAALGITRATLYAYTSRGQLRSEAVPGTSRERRYFRDDVERLRERKQVRRDPAAAAARGLHWGGPVLDSAITLIHNGRLYYRGRDAIELAKQATVEEVAAWLWGADTDEPVWTDRAAPLSPAQQRSIHAAARNPLTAIQMALPAAGGADAAGHDLRAKSVRQTGARILRLMVAVLSQRASTAPLHQALQEAWASRRPNLGDVIRTALILCADHELNVSAFAARCAASAGASPYDVVSTGLATLKGFRHGGAAERVLRLLPGAATLPRAREIIGGGLRRGEGVPGFGHPLYPSGDPRAELLLDLAARGDKTAWRQLQPVLRAGAELSNDRPNLDFGLAAITHTYKLPDGAPLVLFAVSRSIGWIAHAIEEYASGQLIRPRARYTGPVPGADAPSHAGVRLQPT